jgi:hypothetical protein
MLRLDILSLFLLMHGRIALSSLRLLCMFSGRSAVGIPAYEGALVSVTISYMLL